MGNRRSRGRRSRAKSKKPIFKKWWFWVIIIIVVGVAYGSAGKQDSNDNKETETNSSTEAQTNIPQSESETEDSLSFNVMKVPNDVTGNWRVATMAEKSIVFAMANPTPEIFPDEAKEGGAFIVGTGRSDFPNQVNNVLAFPGIFRGALDVRASEINEEMKVAAAYAIAKIIKDDELTTEFVLPDAFDPRVGKEVSAAVAKAARETGVARI